MQKYMIIISTTALIATVWLTIFFMDNSANMQKNDWYMQNGMYYYSSTNKLFNGTITQKALKKTMVNEIKNGEKTGWFKVFNGKNQLEMKGMLHKNVNQGKWTYYYPNGNLQSEGNFDNDVPVGKWIWYYEDAKIKEISMFYKGIRHGEYIHYNKKGEIIDKRFYINGNSQKMLYNI